MTHGSGLAEFRRSQKMTQLEFGEFIGVAQRTVAAYESGERKPSTKVLNTISEKFGEPIERVWRMVYGAPTAGAGK